LNKYDLNGNLIFSRILHSDTLNNMLVDIDVLDDTTLAMVGKCTHGYYDWIYIGVFTADTSGNLLHSMQNENGSPLEECLSITSDKKIFCTGISPLGYSSPFDAFAIKLNANLEYDSIYTQPFTYDSLCPYPIISDTVLCDCEPFVSVKEAKQVSETLKLYPNPAQDFVNVELGAGNTSRSIITVSDIYGRVVYQAEVPPGVVQAGINCGQWLPGIYMVTCNTGARLKTAKLIKP
jgi:hypothetical protein